LNRVVYSGPEAFFMSTSVERHHGPCAITDIELPDVLRIASVLRLGLHEDFPDPPEAVELVHVVAAEKRLQSAVDVLNGHAELEHLVVVDAREELRDRGGEGEREAAELRSLLRGLQEPLRVLPEVVDRVAGSVLDEEIDAARLSDAGDRGWEKCEGQRLG